MQQYGNVLLTGGAGFLGSQLLKKLLPVSKHLFVIDDLSTGNRGAIPNANNLTFYHDTITNEDLLEEILPKVEWIYHLACANLVLSVDQLQNDYHTNLYGGFLLLEKSKACCSNLRRFIYTSTASIYGNSPQIPSPESFYQISLPYAASKFSMEHYCQVYHQLYDLPVTTLRLSNVYGPGQLVTNPYCGVVAKFFDSIKKGIPISIYGDGTQTRDFTYVEDAMQALLMAGHHPGMIGKIYNVGTGMETSVNKLAELLKEITGNDSHPVVMKPKRIVDKVYRRAVDPSFLIRDTQWKVNYPLKRGLSETYKWLQNGDPV